MRSITLLAAVMPQAVALTAASARLPAMPQAVALMPASARLPAAATRRSRRVLLFTEEIATSVSIKRSAEACYDAYSQLERIPEWCTMLGQIKIVSPTRSEWRPRLPIGLARILPTIEWTSEQCLDPEECSIEWQSISGIENCGRAEFQAVGPDSCEFTLTIRYTMPNWLQPVVTSPPARAFVRSTVNTTVEQFKAIIEEEAVVEVEAEVGVDGLEVASATAASATAARLETLRSEQRRAAAAAALTAAGGGSCRAVLEATLEEAEAAGVDEGEVLKAAARLVALTVGEDEEDEEVEERQVEWGRRRREDEEVGAADAALSRPPASDVSEAPPSAPGLPSPSLSQEATESEGQPHLESDPVFTAPVFTSSG